MAGRGTVLGSGTARRVLVRDGHPELSTRILYFLPVCLEAQDPRPGR